VRLVHHRRTNAHYHPLGADTMTTHLS